jgi:hypothetical protein
MGVPEGNRWVSHVAVDGSGGEGGAEVEDGGNNEGKKDKGGEKRVTRRISRVLRLGTGKSIVLEKSNWRMQAVAREARSDW